MRAERNPNDRADRALKVVGVFAALFLLLVLIKSNTYGPIIEETRIRSVRWRDPHRFAAALERNRFRLPIGLFTSKSSLGHRLFRSVVQQGQHHGRPRGGQNAGVDRSCEPEAGDPGSGPLDVANRWRRHVVGRRHASSVSRALARVTYMLIGALSIGPVAPLARRRCPAP